MENSITEKEQNGTEPNRKKIFGGKISFNTLVAIMLAICALTTAWATWIGDLHESEQNASYAKAERLNAEANASYNLNSQLYIAVFNIWTTAYSLNAEAQALSAAGDTQGANAKRQQMNEYIETNCPDYQNFKSAVYAALEKGGTATPFDDYPQASFYSDSEKLAEEATQAREEGNNCNLAHDSYGLVSVFYSLCLFLFGMVGFYQQRLPRRIIFTVGVAVFAIGTIYMLSLPLPADFDFGNYFKLSQ